MLKIDDYMAHAEECRRLANSATVPHIREELLKMAEAWLQIAEQRRSMLALKGEADDEA